MLILTKEQTLLNISTTNISALNSKEIQPSNAEDAFVSTISPIRAVAFAMMDARRRQMRQPPQQQKEHQQQTIDAV